MGRKDIGEQKTLYTNICPGSMLETIKGNEIDYTWSWLSWCAPSCGDGVGRATKFNVRHIEKYLEIQTTMGI